MYNFIGQVVRVNWYWFCKTTNVVNKENVYELSFPKRNGVGFGSILYRFFFAYLDSRYVLAMVLLINFLYQEESYFS